MASREPSTPSPHPPERRKPETRYLLATVGACLRGWTGSVTRALAQKPLPALVRRGPDDGSCARVAQEEPPRT